MVSLRVRPAGAATSVLALGVVETLAATRRTSLLDSVGDAIVALTPLPLVELGVRLLGTTDKPAIRLQLTAGAAIAGSVLLPGRAASPAALARGAVGVGLLAGARYALERAERDHDAQHMVAIGSEDLPLPTDGAEHWPGVEPLFTDPQRFYRTDVNMMAPLIDPTIWRLDVTDHTGTSALLTLADLHAMGPRDRNSLLICVHNRLGWDRLGHQRWTGVPVAGVLRQADLALPATPEDFDLVMRDVGGYRQVMPLAEALAGDSWVVLGMGGRRLSAGHGFPARVMTPGVAGQYNGVKWLQSLAITPRGSEQATWVERGWPEKSVLPPPMARIDHPGSAGMPPRLPQRPVESRGSVALVGTAWAPGNGGVAQVEVQVDERGWQRAELAADLGPHSWRRWRATVEVPEGRSRVRARVHAHDGTVQDGTPRPPYPNGATGHHSIAVESR